MPFKGFDYCIICDGFRQEIGGKLTILGFYNLTPHADISIANPATPVVLAFIAGFPPAEDAASVQYMYSIQIDGPENRHMVHTPIARLNVSNVARGFVGQIFSISPPYRFGLYTIRITVNDNLALNANFRLRQASTDELARMGFMSPTSGRPN